ncbi:MAG: hypothetical protein Q7T44_17440 [Parvibaculum sp.]|nr:hypothetical protein [Parvibaculum sp.]
MDNTNSSRLTPQRLNFVIAVCAILISAASFYATFLQASAADKQVRAMTLPLIQFEHGNYDENLNQRGIYFRLKNAGVGPAMVRSVKMAYRGEEYSQIEAYFRACCGDSYELYEQAQKEFATGEYSALDGGMLTSILTDFIVAGQSDYMFLQLDYGDMSSAFWDKLNQERWSLKLDVCYCTLLDDCFISQGSGQITEIKSCPVE